MAEPMIHIDFTHENYKKLFPDDKVSTPTGEVKPEGHQFEKLEEEKRQKYLGGMRQTLADPILIINQEDDRGKAQLFAKSFNDDPEKLRYLMSVIADMNGTKSFYINSSKRLKQHTKQNKKAAVKRLFVSIQLRHNFFLMAVYDVLL